MVEIFGPEHDEYRTSIRAELSRFAATDIDEWLRIGHIPRSVLTKLGRAGLFARRWDAGFLGGLPYAMVAAEELVAVSSGLALAAMTHGEVFLGALELLARTPFACGVRGAAREGTAVGCFAATEHGAGSDLAGITTTASPSKQGWRIRGTKHWIGNARSATHALVLARVTGESAGQGLGLFLLPMGHDGVSVGPARSKAGLHDCENVDVDIDAEVGDDTLLGAPGGGMIFATQVLQLERLSIAAQVVAASQNALRLIIAFARQRRIGEHRLIDKQAVLHRLADASVNLRAAETLLHAVVARAVREGTVGRDAAAVKLFCTRTAHDVLDESLQLLGGRGYFADYPIERAWRDLRAARIGGGSDEVLRELIGAGLDRPDAYFDDLVSRLEQRDRAVIELGEPKTKEALHA